MAEDTQSTVSPGGMVALGLTLACFQLAAWGIGHAWEAAMRPGIDSSRADLLKAMSDRDEAEANATVQAMRHKAAVDAAVASPNRPDLQAAHTNVRRDHTAARLALTEAELRVEYAKRRLARAMGM